MVKYASHISMIYLFYTELSDANWEVMQDAICIKIPS